MPELSLSDSRVMLGQIETQWSLVAQAHGEETTEAQVLKHVVLGHYSGPVFRYLMGAVRNEEAAMELAHEFALRLLRGDFHRVNPDRGRFRDYIKTVLINLVRDHVNSARQSPKQFAANAPDPAVNPDPASPDPNESFEDCITKHLIAMAWERLEAANVRQYAVLLIKTESEPDAPSRELSARVKERFGFELTSVTFRKTLERARTRFAALLTEAAAEVTHADSPDELKQELKALGLASYCVPEDEAV